MTPKKIPMRQCLGCRERRPKKELVRVVRGTDGVVFVDNSGKANGRGAYLCPDEECLKRAVRSHALDRALETSIPPEIITRLEREFIDEG